MVSPVISLNANHILSLPEDILSGANNAMEAGKLEGDNALRRIIKEQSEAYILDKASQLGLCLEVRVDVSEDDVPIPDRVFMRGGASAYSKMALELYVQENLGIPRERQQWID